MAINLNNARRATLKTAIEADATLNAMPKTTAGSAAVAKELNKNSAVIVWRSSVTKSDVLERIDIADAQALTAANRDILSTYLMGENVPCDRARVRAAFAALFGATGTATRLLALWKRTATAGEAVFASGGSGTDADPHNLGVEGDFDGALIEEVRA